MLTDVALETADADDTPMPLETAMAVYLISQHVPTVVLHGLDLAMPRMNGFYFQAQNLPVDRITAELKAKTAAAQEKLLRLPTATAASVSNELHTPAAAADAVSPL
jgi:hypothetical protein